MAPTLFDRRLLLLIASLDSCWTAREKKRKKKKKRYLYMFRISNNELQVLPCTRPGSNFHFMLMLKPFPPLSRFCCASI
ncbi:hypothetical protein DFH05DRAFT_754958 [Lentinula detonsa]|uniref:Secreted protein n=1 Tax=Lentinula detonsa TaxID=2804962 RepID=A0A9W8NPZ2_9AGAR|nr:hypothetical protein DFH05DRAFT_754958 [Lentinula detonsa]